MQTYDWIVWALFLVVPFVIFWQSATSLADQGVASGGPMENAAQFPRMVAWLLLGLSVLNGLRLGLNRISERSPLEPTPTTRLALVTSGGFLVYLLMLPYLGYHLSTPILISALLILFGLPAIASALGALVMSLMVAAVFEGLLNVVLPVGLFQISVFG
ncbi:tripartite tricarboxylate transporter TctB family protein [Pseudotabrizicola sediminis]|nr:tripartite tricarboxylate transporter TctB family protein [Pseudotabrizicola sediminis]